MIKIGSYNCRILVSTYHHFNNTSLQLIDPEEGPYATMTVNIAELPSGYAALDTNNFPEVEDIMAEYKLGTPTGFYLASGYCVYPVYKLNLINIEKHS